MNQQRSDETPGLSYVDYSEPSSSPEAGSRLTSPYTPSSPVFRSRHDSQINPLIQSDRPPQAKMTGRRVLQPSKTSIHAARPPSFWDTLLHSKWSMVICLAIGVAAALGHHFLYWHLDGREAINQQWWLRLGQFISFCAKAAFVLALLMAHSQAAWREVGLRSYSVKAVDSLFGAAHDATELFSREAWKKSWLVMFLAIYVWASPLVVIFSSATLNVVAETKREETMCPSVRTLNFSHEETNDFRYINIPEGQELRSLSFSLWNTTTPSPDDEGHIDYWTKTSDQFASIAYKVLYGKDAIAREDVALEVCGPGWNCSTTINFVGPGYKCEQLASGDDTEIKQFNGTSAPFNLTDIAPRGNLTYFAVADEGDYDPQQINSGEAGIPVDLEPPFPKNLGAFRTEPVIWLGYASVENLTVKHPDLNDGSDEWNKAYEPVVFACDHYELNYTVNLNYTGGLQSYEVVKRDYLHKIVDTKFVRGEDADDGTLDETKAVPEENYVFPADIANYRRTAAYHSMGKQLRDLIHGDIKIPGTITESKVIPSRLIDRHEWLPVPNLQEEVRRLYEDIIISLFSDPQMIAVSWASDASKRSGVAVGGEDTNHPCLRQQTGNFFFYQWQVLLTVYTISLVIATVGVVSGFLAMHKEGFQEQREMSFSSIAESTNGAKIFREVDKDTMIRYVRVDGHGGESVYQFEREDGRYESSSRSDIGDKNRSSVREVGGV
ncbi:hypothetical protein EDB81DRAFT_905796 [Dactylonectria macrodidyma]|uniref:Uncharacterized protein n=1 Tax=Dactylonectria macrodidyma TaxID=307937 RepID=A0A9P9E2B3_9HYPO|nr:hypothetical protein EDB81DRAFT_905796 [Dactylonectria macrodidyma]